MIEPQRCPPGKLQSSLNNYVKLGKGNLCSYVLMSLAKRRGFIGGEWSGGCSEVSSILVKERVCVSVCLCACVCLCLSVCVCMWGLMGMAIWVETEVQPVAKWRRTSVNSSKERGQVTLLTLVLSHGEILSQVKLN